MDFIKLGNVQFKWHGQFITSMSRDELISAMDKLARLYFASIKREQLMRKAIQNMLPDMNNFSTN